MFLISSREGDREGDEGKQVEKRKRLKEEEDGGAARAYRRKYKLLCIRLF